MTDRVLFVDDDVQILSGFRRGLRKQFDLETAEGGAAGLEVLESQGPFAVVISDQQMPNMDGVAFLKEVKNRSPLTVRMMLTGNADQQTALTAVNEGNIFQFLNKPCPPEKLAKAIQAGQQQYKLLTAEKELLEKTLAGSVKVLVEVLSLHDPEVFKQTARLRSWARKVATHLSLPGTWELDMTVMLSSIGRVTLPAEVTAKLHAGQELDSVEQDLIARTPKVARDLITNIPRMEGIANAIYYQNKGFDGSGFPADQVAGKDIPLEARVLKLLSDLAALSSVDAPPPTAFEKLKEKGVLYDPKILDAARQCLGGRPQIASGTAPTATLNVTVAHLQAGQKIAADVTSEAGVMVLSAGYVLTAPLIEKLQQYHRVRPINEPIKVVKA